jgi:hypothetical protein
MKKLALTLVLALALAYAATIRAPALQGIDLSSSNTGITPACASYTVTDQTVAVLTFTLISVEQCQYANLVYVFGVFTFPSTADTHSATISLPVAVPNQNYAGNTCSFAMENGIQDIYVCPIKATSTFQIFTSSSAANKTNANLSTKAITFTLLYPVQ